MPIADEYRAVAAARSQRITDFIITWHGFCFCIAVNASSWKRKENKMNKYVPLNSLEVPRFADIKTYMRLPNIKTTKDIDYAIVGVPFDTATTYRPGARFGPASIRDISSLIKPYNIPHDINVVDKLSGVDYGDVPVNPDFIEDTYDRMVATLDPLVSDGVIPICMGGDHSITLGELRSIAKNTGRWLLCILIRISTP